MCEANAGFRGPVQAGHDAAFGARIAGQWCVNAGYGQESVAAAAAEQMRRLRYATGYLALSSLRRNRLSQWIEAGSWLETGRVFGRTPPGARAMRA